MTATSIKSKDISLQDDSNHSSSLHRHPHHHTMENKWKVNNHNSLIEINLTRAASPIVVPANRIKGEMSSSLSNSISRPESRCSLHSTTSANSSAPSRTTTSRRGGRVSRSRSPISFSSRPSSNSLHINSRTFGSSPSSSPPIHQKSDPPSSIEGKKEINDIKVEPGRQVRKNVDVVSSVAAKAAAEAQRLWLYAQDNEIHGRGNIDGQRGDRGYWGRHSHDRQGHDTEDESNAISHERAQDDNVQHTNDGSVSDYRQGVFRRRHREGNDDNHSDVNFFDKKSFTVTRSMSRIKKPKIGNGGTSLVMGTATPMHVPRAESKSQCQEQSFLASPRNDSSLEVRFDNFAAPPGSPQRLLLDFKSGSRSFELRSPLPTPKKRSTLPLSPQGPPQIQHAHQQMNPNSLFMELQKSPRTPKTPKSPNVSYVKNNNALLGTPSFNFFNQDFDLFDGNDNFNLPTPNPNSNSLLENGSRSPAFSLGHSFDGCSPRKNLLNSPYLEDLESGFSPGPTSRGQSNVPKLNEITIEGAPPMPEVATAQTQDESGSQNKSFLDFKCSPHRPPKKRFLDQEKQSITKSIEMSPKKDGPAIVKPSPQHIHNTPHKLASKAGFESMPSYRSISYPRNIRRSHQYHHGTKEREPSLSGMNASQFYQRLIRHKEAFSRCSFLLPGLKAIMNQPKNNDSETLNGVKRNGTELENDCESHLSDQGNSSIRSKDSIGKNNAARRRISSALCAFGGNCNPYDAGTKKSSQSVFRVKTEESILSKVEADGERLSKSKYNELLSNRFYESENRISWENEEDPPVETTSIICSHSGDDLTVKRKMPSPSQDEQTPLKKIKSDNIYDVSSPTGSASDQPKMRYRCKLCGQPKQNHVCPYQQSLQRNIGIMVYPAVNSFSAVEPGYLAPALSEMNNFVNGNDDTLSENTPSRPSPTRLMIKKSFAIPSPMVVPHNVTPESLRSGQNNRVPIKPSEMSSPETIVLRTPFSRARHYPPHYRMPMVRRATPVSMRRKSLLSPETRSDKSKGSHRDILFMEKTDLMPEQFRIVSISNTSSPAYKYPSLPLPYKQRKTLSDSLFALSKEVPKLTDECALVLRKAREQDKWDMAVAELLTQVIVVIHCPEEDSRLDGLSSYLLSLGFAC